MGLEAKIEDVGLQTIEEEQCYCGKITILYLTRLAIRYYDREIGGFFVKLCKDCQNKLTKAFNIINTILGGLNYGGEP